MLIISPITTENTIHNSASRLLIHGLDTSKHLDDLPQEKQTDNEVSTQRYKQIVTFTMLKFHSGRTKIHCSSNICFVFKLRVRVMVN